VVTYMFNPFFQRIGFTNLLGSVTFSIPDEYEGVTVKATHPLYEKVRSVWHNDYEVDILMKYTGVNLNYQQQSSAYQQSNLQIPISSQQSTPTSTPSGSPTSS